MEFLLKKYFVDAMLKVTFGFTNTVIEGKKMALSISEVFFPVRNNSDEK
jgi:hypothetical protein